jgi:two-component system cell cycle response regulator DivK
MVGRILLVEDNPHLQELCGDFLELEGYTVRTVEDGAHFFSAIAEFRPQLILLDIKLPDIDGLTLLEQLRQSEWGSIPTIIWSAHDLERYRKRGFQLGVKHYLTKPADPLLLLETIEVELSNWKQQAL